MMHRIVVAVLSAAILMVGFSAQRQVTTSHPTSRVPWAPALSEVAHVQLNLNGTPVSPALPGPGPLEINPTTTESRAVVSKLLSWLRQAKPLPQAPIPLPSFGDHMLSFALRDGKFVTVSQYFVPAGSGVYRASPSVVLVWALGASKSGRYRDPAVAQWLNAGWSADLAKLASHWTCASKRPANPYKNEIHGVFANGTQWVAAADAAQGCAVLYTTKGTGWKATLIATHVFSSPSSGANVEQAQFLDSMHGFVLISGSLHAGQLTRVLFVTEDGGATWHAMPVDAEQPFPYSDSMVNMRFTSFRVGWLVTLNNSYDPDRVFVYHTTSGGETWTETDFSLPANVHTSDLRLVLPPAFQNAHDGTIQVVFQWGGTLFFSTTDGGKHWTLDPLGNG